MEFKFITKPNLLLLVVSGILFITIFLPWWSFDFGYLLGGSYTVNGFHNGGVLTFPELKKFGEQMKGDPWGTGYYSFYTRGKEEKIIYKVAAWDTVSPLGRAAWKVVVTHPYFLK